MKTTRTYSPYALEAARILGTEVARARRERRWTLRDLAARAGITPTTLSKVERGDPTVGLGTAFEVAALVGVPLFGAEPNSLAEVARRSEERLALLPRRVREPKGPVKDDF
ncbi:helix-turn-helix domain-containing protein [Candidatus Poriferisocius sp.]|uniref:helix-turn-helix domain-containing protein n=1 Tax=Candidatus Poriferisocius sp. TaxID=3101276 RepID=UPI003B58FA0C